MKKRSEKEHRATAYHEAGHAVAAFLLDRPFRRVSIIQDEEGHGHVLYRKFHKRFDPEYGSNPQKARFQIERAIITLMAGGEAERVHTGRRNNLGSSSDDETARDLATYIVPDWGDELVAYLKWLRIRTRNLLKSPRNWRAVEELAEALMEKGEMSAAEAKDTIIRGLRAWSAEQG